MRFHTRVNGVDFVAPQTVGMPDLGAVVGTGQTLLEAVRQCKERAEQIKGFDLKISLEGIDKAMEYIVQGEKMGVKFADNLPSAEQVRKA